MNVYAISHGNGLGKGNDIYLYHKDKISHKEFKKLFDKTAQKLSKKGKLENKSVQEAAYRIAKRMCKDYGFKFLEPDVTLQIVQNEFNVKYGTFETMSFKKKK